MTNNIKKLLRCASMNHNVQLIINGRGGYRKHHPLGSTFVPQKVIRINGKSFSFAGARQYLGISK